MCFCQTPPNARSSEGISIIRTRNNEVKQADAKQAGAPRSLAQRMVNKQTRGRSRQIQTHHINRAPHCLSAPLIGRLVN